MKQEALLRNWRFEWLEGEQCNVAIGNVYGHPRFPDGYRIHTSKIVDWAVNYGVIQTLHTYYQLEDYEQYEVDESSELERRPSEGNTAVSKNVIPLRQRVKLGRER